MLRVRLDPFVLGRADGAVGTRSIDVLTEVLKGEVTRRLETGLEGLHNNKRILQGARQKKGYISSCLTSK